MGGQSYDDEATEKVTANPNPQTSTTTAPPATNPDGSTETVVKDKGQVSSKADGDGSTETIVTPEDDTAATAATDKEVVPVRDGIKLV